MEDLDRRSALAFGLVAASGLALPNSSAAQPSGTSEGVERAPGVRMVNHTSHMAMLPGYKTVSMRDFIYQPGSKTESPSMPNDMVCHVPEGELRITQSDGDNFVAMKGKVWSCKKRLGENVENASSSAAIMRVIDLLPE